MKKFEYFNRKDLISLSSIQQIVIEAEFVFLPLSIIDFVSSFLSPQLKPLSQFSYRTDICIEMDKNKTINMEKTNGKE